MSELEQHTAPANGDVSHLAWLRKRHDELSADRTLDVFVPGYHDRLALRCGPVPWPVVARVQTLLTRTDRDGSALLAAQSDMLIAACRDVLVRNTPEGELESIDPSGEPCRVGRELADTLGSGTTSARATLAWLFPSEVALSSAANDLFEWTRTTNSETADELAGE